MYADVIVPFRRSSIIFSAYILCGSNTMVNLVTGTESDQRLIDDDSVTRRNPFGDGFVVIIIIIIIMIK